ncbi:hypothetical protein K3495_g2769 [Podosphaera aphanis]|nr:hypothetical protein K3495_g2769 [Podosphaera aphanis]
MATEMATDMEIDMDIDMDLDIDYNEDTAVNDNEARSSLSAVHNDSEEEPILSPPNNTSEPNFLDPVPQKVYLRGLDHLTTDDIKSFAAQYYDIHKPSYVEWINDISANLVYSSSEIALDALKSFAAADIPDKSNSSVLQTVPAKPFPHYPLTKLEIRLAVLGDKKQAGARERSRFYLLNPEYDPAERRKRASNNKSTKKYRDRQDGAYTSRKYDDREQKKRERDTEFDNSFYDDDETITSEPSENKRQRKRRYDNSGNTGSRSQEVRSVRSERELFPDLPGADGGRLRNQSASPLRSSNRRNGRSKSASVNRSRPLDTQGNLKQNGPKELFPEKLSHPLRSIHSRKDQKIDLFSDGMSFTSLRRNENTRPTNNRNQKSSKQIGGFNIRGLVNGTPPSPPTQEFLIKGAASDVRVKELFPTLQDGSGKESFSSILGGNSQRRKKAEDLFY